MENHKFTIAVVFAALVGVTSCGFVLADSDHYRGGDHEHEEHEDDHGRGYDEEDDDDDDYERRTARLYCYDAGGGFLGNARSNAANETCYDTPLGGQVETVNPPANGLFSK